jgi:hypothetical protein
MTRLETSKDAATAIAAAIKFIFQDFYPTYGYILADGEAKKKIFQHFRVNANN